MNVLFQGCNTRVALHARIVARDLRITTYVIVGPCSATPAIADPGCLVPGVTGGFHFGAGLSLNSWIPSPGESSLMGGAKRPVQIIETGLQSFYRLSMSVGQKLSPWWTSDRELMGNAIELTSFPSVYIVIQACIF